MSAGMSQCCAPRYFETNLGVASCCVLFASHFPVRYFFPFISTSSDLVFLKWDNDEGSATEMTIVLYSMDPVTSIILIEGVETSVSALCDK